MFEEEEGIIFDLLSPLSATETKNLLRRVISKLVDETEFPVRKADLEEIKEALK